MSDYPFPRHPDLDRRALRDRVYDLILAMLLSGVVEAGAKLSIDTLARQLDVSPTPVREAMVQLERTGLVTREALKGYRVAPLLDDAQLEELFDARLVIEVGAARLAGERADRRLRSELSRLHAEHGRLATRVVEQIGASGEADLASIQAYFDADGAFHRAIFRGGGNRFMVGMYDDLGALTHRLRQAVVRGADDVEEAHSEHAAILEAFDSGSGDTVAEAMRAHIHGVRTRSLQPE